MSVSEAIPGASRLRNQNEILIEKSDEAIKKTKSRNRLFYKIFFKYFFGSRSLIIDDFLHRKIRARGNFIEYTPIFLIMLMLVEINGFDKYFIHFFGIVFISGRALHAYGIVVAEVRARNFFFRQAGMFCTFFCLSSLALILCFQFVKNS
jgi:uncharacterized membrane protein YecN with MAPEG domain